MQKDGWAVWIKDEPLLENMRDDARYQAFLRKMKLYE